MWCLKRDVDGGAVEWCREAFHRGQSSVYEVGDG